MEVSVFFFKGISEFITISKRNGYVGFVKKICHKQRRMKMELKLARKAIKSNYPPENYTILREALDWLLEQTEKVEELQRRIDKVTAECGVTWINEVLKGEEPPRISIKPEKSGTSLSPTEWLDYK